MKLFIDQLVGVEKAGIVAGLLLPFSIIFGDLSNPYLHILTSVGSIAVALMLVHTFIVRGKADE